MGGDISKSDSEGADDRVIYSIDICEAFHPREDQCANTEEEKEDKSLHHKLTLNMMQAARF